MHDGRAPTAPASAESSRRIKFLIAEGKNFILAVYPAAEHGMTLHELEAKDEHLPTRYARVIRHYSTTNAF